MGREKKMGEVPRLSFGSVIEAVEPLALGQREGLAQPASQRDRNFLGKWRSLLGVHHDVGAQKQPVR